MQRNRFHFDVPLQNEKGATLTQRVSTFWSPDHDTTMQGVREAGAIEAAKETGKPWHTVGDPVFVDTGELVAV